MFGHSSPSQFKDNANAMESTYEDTNTTPNGFFAIRPKKIKKFAHVLEKIEDLIDDMIRETENKGKQYERAIKKVKNTNQSAIDYLTRQNLTCGSKNDFSVSGRQELMKKIEKQIFLNSNLARRCSELSNENNKIRESLYKIDCKNSKTSSSLSSQIFQELESLQEQNAQLMREGLRICAKYT